MWRGVEGRPMFSQNYWRTCYSERLEIQETLRRTGDTLFLTFKYDDLLLFKSDLDEILIGTSARRHLWKHREKILLITCRSSRFDAGWFTKRFCGFVKRSITNSFALNFQIRFTFSGADSKHRHIENSLQNFETENFFVDIYVHARSTVKFDVMEEKSCP